MTLRQAKALCLSAVTRLNTKASVWHVQFRLSNGETTGRIFKKRYQAEEFANLILGAVITEQRRGEIVE